MRKLAGIAFIDYRFVTQLVITVAGVAAFVIATGQSNFEETLDAGTRSTLYVSLAGTSAALLGFVLTALAVIVGLPSTGRIDDLREHPKWQRIPSAYFRASRALLVLLIVSTLGLALDSARDPWEVWEYFTVAAAAWAVGRVAASLVALDQVLAVASAPPRKPGIDDPGP